MIEEFKRGNLIFRHRRLKPHQANNGVFAPGEGYILWLISSPTRPLCWLGNFRTVESIMAHVDMYYVGESAVIPTGETSDIEFMKCGQRFKYRPLSDADDEKGTNLPMPGYRLHVFPSGIIEWMGDYASKGEMMNHIDEVFGSAR